MREFLMVGLGGFAGATARYSVLWFVQNFVKRSFFPYGTLLVNLVGCLIVGAVLELMESRGMFDESIRCFLVVGVLGAFTTFSSFSAETMALFSQGRELAAVVNMAANVILCLAGVYAAKMLVMSIYH